MCERQGQSIGAACSYSHFLLGRLADPFETICVLKWKELVDISTVMMYNKEDQIKIPRVRKGSINGFNC